MPENLGCPPGATATHACRVHEYPLAQDVHCMDILGTFVLLSGPSENHNIPYCGNLPIQVNKCMWIRDRVIVVQKITIASLIVHFNIATEHRCT
jgi:hypothetical protein